MECKFEGCKNPRLSLSEFCWEHVPDKDAYRKKVVEAAGRGDDLAGHNFSKVALTGARLENAKLSKANLSQSNLAGCHLFNSKLDGADLVGTNLSGCELTNCDFRGADLTKATLENSRLWNANLSGANLVEANLSGADLWNTRLFNVKLWHADFDNAKFLTMRNFGRQPNASKGATINENGLVSAEESYRDLKKYFITNGMYNDASWAAFKEKTMERMLLKKRGDLDYFPSLLMDVLCGYGEKQGRIVAAAILTVLAYAAVYSFLGAMRSTTDPSYIPTAADYIYVSTVTFTTVGYGDFVPRASAICRFLAASEAFIGVFLTGLFIFTLARKYSGR